MPRALKITLVALAAVLALLVAAVAYFAATFDPNDHKPRLIERVQQDYRRTLAIPGEVRLSFFPRLGVQLGAVSMSEPGSTQRFAQVESARVSLALLPLLRGQAVVDRIQVAGLQAQVTRFADGRTSIDDLIKPATPPAPGAPASAPQGQPMQFDIAGIEVSNAALVFDDRQARRRVELAGASLQSGRITPGEPGELRFEGRVKSSVPVVDAAVTLQGRFLLEPAKRHYAFSQLKAQLDGQLATLAKAKLQVGGQADVQLAPLALDIAGLEVTLQGQPAGGTLDATLSVPSLRLDERALRAGKIAASATLKQGTRTVALRLALPDFNGSAPAFKLPALQGELNVEDGPLRAQATIGGALEGNTERLLFTSPQTKLAFSGKQGANEIKGSVTTPWTLDLKQQTAALPRVVIDGVLPNPKGGTLALALQGSANVQLGAQRLESTWTGKLDDSRIEAKLGLASFSPAAPRFDITIDRIDADRYRAAAPAAGARPASAPPAADVPIDLAALRDLNAQGSLKVGALQVAGLKLANLRVDLRAAGGKLELAPLAADLYQGRTSGSLTLVAASPPRVVLKQSLTQVAVGPLLKDLLGRDSLEGRGDVALDISAQGATVGAMKKALAGDARLALRDGAVRGFNIAGVLRGAKARLGLGGAAPGGTQGGTGSQAESTDFSEMGGSFRIARGVARTEDLQAKSPLLRVGAAGDVDLGESRLDMLVKATVVSTLQGQGGPELQALRGQTVPVRLSGPFTAIGWKVDFAGLAQDLAKQKLDDKADALKEKAKEKLGDKLKGLFGR